MCRSEHEHNTILPMTLSLSRRAWIVTIAGAASIVTLVGGALGYTAYYADRVVPGVTIAGESVSSTTAQVLRELLEKRVNEAALKLSVDGQEHVASLADLGVSVNIDEAIDSAFVPSRSVSGRLSTPFTGHDVALSYSLDDGALRKFARTLISDADSHMTDASVAFSAESGKFTVTPGKTGKTIPFDSLKNAAVELASHLNQAELTLVPTQEEPKISTEAAQKYADAAQKLIETPISISDGIESFSPTAAEKSAWIDQPTAGQKLDSPSINSGKLAEWVKATAKSTNVEPAPGVNNVNTRGEVVSVHDPGTTGWTVNNADAVAKAVEESFRQGKEYIGSFDYDQKKPEMTTRLIADGVATHIYAAAPGEKWIDIDLSTNTVTAYEGGTTVYGPVYMVPGAPETPTVTGKFRVWLQNPLQTMRGLNADGTKYETPNVPWATYFHGDYALHGAPWRSSFGWNGPGGSHGCVNMPVDGARWIYEWASIGTVVVSHY